MANSTLRGLRLQIARRNAEFADLHAIGGADRELDEAIGVLRSDEDTLPKMLLAKLKGFLSARPSTFADPDAQLFIGDDRIADAVKSGVRKTFANQHIADELGIAEAVYRELFAGDGMFGQTLLEDAVRFAVLTVLAHLTPANRFTLDFMNEATNRVIGRLDEMSKQIEATRTSEQALVSIERTLRDLEDVWKGVVQVERGVKPEASITHSLDDRDGRTALVFSDAVSNETLQILSAAEVQKRLTPEERVLLLDTEAAMAKKIEAWRRTSAEIDDPGAANIEQKKRLLRIAAAMSDDLTSIFAAIERTLNGALQDHYGAERWIASRAAGLLHQLELESYGPLERDFGD